MSNVKQVLHLLSQGGMAVVFDDESRENEADIIAPIEHLTPEKVNFMVHNAGGLICAAVGENIARSKGFPLMSTNKMDKHATAFTLSIDSRSVKTGISPAERCQTAKDLLNPSFTIADFVIPGHLFPLIARKGGVVERQGHTEAAVSLCEWSGLQPAALICEMINRDGVMYNREEANFFALKNGLGFCTLGELIEYSKLNYSNVEKIATAKLPTEYGIFDASVYRELYTNEEHFFLSMGNYHTGPVRIHSECLTGDVFASRKCDCGMQLQASLKLIGKEGKGAIVYLKQEGRGIGLAEKIKAYALQQNGMDTVEANLHLGHAPDERDFHQAAWILKHEGFRDVHLLTNNPEKGITLQKHGLQVSYQTLEVPTCTESIDYLLTKKHKLGHKLKLEEFII